MYQLSYKIYNTSLDSLYFDDFKNQENVENYLSNKLSSITKLRNEDTFFIMHDDKTIVSDNSELSVFFTKYMNEITPSLETPNRVYDFYGDDRTIDTHIKMLRNNLGEYRNLIKTVRAVGYKFEIKD